ncbi:MAG TPA: hypothetical protein VGE90_07150 [Chitinophaga sp.]
METLQLILPETYRQLAAFRSEDAYLPEMDWELLVADFFPPTITDVVQNLSNTTAAFYGLMLKEAGNRFGTKIMDELSKATLYALGKRTAGNITGNKPGLEKDARGIAVVAVAAIYNASPEYSFEFLQFEPQEVKMLIKGVDRYHRIAQQLDIGSWLTSPISAFVQGINDGMSLPYRTSCELKSINEQSHCLYELNISL